MDNITMTNNSTGFVTKIIPVPKTEEDSHTLAYVMVPLGALAIVAIIAFVVMMIFRKNRMERLRHHLMPLYNFDPQEEDWESELLEDRGRRISYRDGSPSPTSPKLKFNT